MERATLVLAGIKLAWISISQKQVKASHLRNNIAEASYNWKEKASCSLPCIAHKAKDAINSVVLNATKSSTREHNKALGLMD
jgi:hypothetical protein